MKFTDMFKSIRFWYAVILAVAFYLDQAGIVPGASMKAVEIFSILGISIRSLDKLGENIGSN